MSDEPKVEQVDREAAAERLAVANLGLTLNDPRNHTAARIRSGDYDNHAWVQAFAHHRIAERERIVAWLRDVAAEQRDYMDGEVSFYVAVAAIERGDHLKGNEDAQ